MFCVMGATVSVFTGKTGQVYVRLGHHRETFILGLWPSGGALLFSIWANDREGKGVGYISHVFTNSTAECL